MANNLPAPKDIRQKKRNKSPLDPLANFTNTLHGDTCDISNRSEKHPSAAAHSVFSLTGTVATKSSHSPELDLLHFLPAATAKLPKSWKYRAAL